MTHPLWDLLFGSFRTPANMPHLAAYDGKIELTMSTNRKRLPNEWLGLLVHKVQPYKNDAYKGSMDHRNVLIIYYML